MAAIDLCGTADVFSFMQKASGDTAQGTIAATLITSASRAILNYTGREFIPGAFGTAPGTAVQTHKFWYRGGDSLRLRPYDLRTAGTVQIDTETASPSTLTENVDYFLEPLPNPFGVFESFRFNTNLGLTGSSLARQLTISGTWGFASVPEDVKDAAVKTVAIWLRRDVNAFSSTFNVDEARLERPENLPSSVRSGLIPYRRAGIG